MGKRFRTYARAGIAMLLLGIIFWRIGGVRVVADVIFKADPYVLVFIVFVYTLNRALMTYKWIMLLGTRGARLPFFLGLKIYCASMIWGMFLPSTVGADAIRAYSTAKSGVDSNEVIASIVIERMIGYISALLLGLCSLILLFRLGSLDERFNFVWWATAGMLVIAILLLAASFSYRTFDILYGLLLQRYSSSWIVSRMKKFHEAYIAYQESKKGLLFFFPSPSQSSSCRSCRPGWLPSAWGSTLAFYM